MENSFAIKDINKKVYFLHFEHKLFWEIGFLDGTCKVYSCSGPLTKNGDKIPSLIEDEGTKDHDRMLTAIQDVETRINKKLQWGYTLADSDVTSYLQPTPINLSSENQINQKRSAESLGLELLSELDSCLKKIDAVASTESNWKTKEAKLEENCEIIQLVDSEDLEEPHIVPPENEEEHRLNFIPEECKGAYLEKIECGETFFYKIQISKNKLMVEEGKLNEPKKHTEIKIYRNPEEAQETMKLLIKDKKKEGYKNTEKKFVYNFQSRGRGRKKLTASLVNAQRTNIDFQKNAPDNLNALTKNSALQQNKRKKENLPCDLKRSLRSRLDTNHDESPQTRLYCSFKPIDWPDSEDPTGFILREKPNGVLCVWNGKDKLTSLKGYGYQMPKQWIQGFPPVSLLGVVTSIVPNSCFHVEKNVGSSDFEKWKKMKFVALDILETDDLPFKKRMETIEELFKGIDSPFIEFCKYSECRDQEHLQNEQAIIKEKKGDGLYLNDPDGESLSGVDAGLYVWKSYTFEEAELLNYVFDQNGEVKSFEVRHRKGNNNAFKIHHGIKSLAKEKIPEIGDVIIYKTVGGRPEGAPTMPIFVKIKSPVETE